MPAVPTGIHFETIDPPGVERPPATTDDRWRQIAGLMQFAARVMETSPDSARIRAFKDLQEEQWQSVQKRLFANVPRS